MSCKIKLLISEEEFARSALSRDEYSSLAFELLHIEAGAPITSELVGDAELLVVELRADDPQSMQRLTGLRTRWPDLPLIVAMRDADFATTRALIRQGVDDVIALPVQRAEFDDAVNNLLALSAKSAEASTDLAPVVAVAQSVGGIGATTVATHLAYFLGANSPHGCCLIDLDLQFGNAASYLGRSASLTMEHLLAAGDRVDGELLRSVAAPGPDGVAVIAAPDKIAPLEAIDSERLMRVIELARQQYDHVILDLPGNWANWTLSAIDKADLILLVVDLSIGSLRQARRRLTLFEETGIDADRIRVVANRIEKRMFRTIGVNDAADALHYPVFASIHSDYAVVQSAQDQGVLVGSVARKNKVAADLSALSDLVVAALGKV
ncbi:AAA family ATPase [Sphingopyxis solisilvae]|uniref:AAA family ATPase n=1 Tax=Sphingopyxis solisilvae TaxID=1886788 RepID=UPI001892968F|nr:AAA family ATPase [Sphingopyxis solisilvae]